MTLRKLAESATIEMAPCICHDDYKARNRVDPMCFGCDYADVITDALVSFAKAFAEKAVKEALRSRPLITVESAPPREEPSLNAPLLWRATVQNDKDADTALVAAAVRAAEEAE